MSDVRACRGEGAGRIELDCDRATVAAGLLPRSDEEMGNLAMNRRERVQALGAQTSEVRDALRHLVEQEGETAMTAVIVQLVLLATQLAEVTVSILAEMDELDDREQGR